MKTTLDGATDCLSKLPTSHEQQVGLKFKRKVLDVLQERHFLKQRRRASRALEPARRQEERPTSGQPAASSEPAQPEEEGEEETKKEKEGKQQEEKIQDSARVSSGQIATRVAAMDDKTLQRPQQQHTQSACLSFGPQQRPLACMGQLDGAHARHQLAGQFQAHIADAKKQFYQVSISLQAAKVLPNNTEVEDLCKCHDNLLPKVTRATAKTVELFSACSPGWLNKRVAHKQPTNGGYINSEAILSDEEEEEDEKEEEERRPEEVRAEAVASSQDSATKNSPSRANQTIRPSRGRRKAKFQVPETVVKLKTSLKQDDYNRGLCILTNDVRYQLHLLLYRRLQTIWTLFSTILCILVPVLLLATLEPLVIACAGLCWLALQILGALLTRQFCARLDQMLEKAVAQVNSYFMDHNLMLGVINVGGLFARARLHVPLLYFDTSQCREQIESIISVDLRKKGEAGDWPGDKGAHKARASGRKWRASNKPARQFSINYSKMGLRHIGTESQMSFAQSQLAKKIVLRYSQRWISFYDKQKLMFTDDTAKPRHLSTGKCLCQFIEEHFKYADFAGDADQTSGSSQQQHQRQSAPTNVIEIKSDTCGQLGGELDASRAAAAVILQMPEPPVDSRKLSPLSSMLRHQNHLSSDLSLQQQLDLLVPTLSHLVSSRDHPKSPADQSNASEFNSYTSSRLLGSLSAQQQQIERLEANSSPTTEHSLDLTEASDSTLASSRNQELIKRLKLLLDSRKDEFARGLDGSINNQSNLASRPLSILGDKSTLNPNMRQLSQSSSTQTINMQDETNNNNNNNSNSSSSPISQLGKRFFSQADGSFFLGSKRSHEGVYGKQQQIVEIC